MSGDTSRLAGILLENLRLITELTEDVGHFKRISIPLIRRIYPQLMASDIVSVQPLNGGASPFLNNYIPWGAAKYPEEEKYDWRKIRLEKRGILKHFVCHKRWY